MVDYEPDYWLIMNLALDLLVFGQNQELAVGELVGDYNLIIG